MALTREQIVTEALRLMDEQGLDALSLRTLAGRLGVQAPTLYWHVKNKAVLLDGLSDVIMAEALAAFPDRALVGVWHDWLIGVFHALRAALLAHRDGARLVSGARDSLGRVEYAELATRRLVDEGIDHREAWLLVLIGTRYTLGHVLTEQGPDGPPSVEVEDEFRRRFPIVADQAADYFSSHGSGELFDEAVRRLIESPSRE